MFSGEIVFSISDDNYIELDMEEGIKPTKQVKKGDIVALGRKAPKYKWIYELKYNGEDEYLERLSKVLDQLFEKKEYIVRLKRIYEDVSINIYIRSDYAQIGYSLPNCIIKKIALLECDIHFDIISFGLALNEKE